ncbi:MAG TPA: putative glycoside hydrolase [Candidatus Saccharimonadales bacterium]
MKLGMPRPDLKRLLQLAVVTAFVVGGVTALRMTQAATPALTAEPDQGVLSGSVAVVLEASASGGRGVKFGVGTGSGLGIGQPGKMGGLWLHLNGTPMSSTMIATEAKRRQIIVLNAWEHSYIPAFKAANPNVMILVYKDLSSTRSYACHNGVDDPLQPAGMGYCSTLASHPDWFLKNAAGARMEYTNYPGHWLMDIGNSAYQQAWLQNVKNDLVARNWDGVLMDNALFACDQYSPGVCPAKYPTNASIQTAYKSMLATTYPGLRAANKISIANLANARLHAGQWDAYTTYLDGGFDEWWLAFGANSYVPEYGSPSQGWKAQVDEVASSVARGKYAIVQPHTGLTDTRGMYFALASYFLVKDSRSVFSEIGATDSYGEPTPWRPAFDWNLGNPTESMTALSTNVYRRTFSCGLVAANASGSYTLNLGKAYLNESGTSVTSVVLAQTTGTVLRVPGCTP